MAAKKLIEALKNEISIPVHLHTHDTSGNGVATLMMAANAGVDIIDAAFNSMSGLNLYDISKHLIYGSVHFLYFSEFMTEAEAVHL